MYKKSGDVLGRGLGSLLGSTPDFVDENALSREIAVDLIDNDPNQPRRIFDEEKMEELAQSVRLHGIMQPLIVSFDGSRYKIIAGERRFRAARMAGLKIIPVIVRDVTEQAALELALIENLQREDLNSIDQALALERLIEEHGLTQDQVAERVGKSRSTIANLIRILNLPKEVVEMVRTGALSAGHAKALLPLIDDEELLLETAQRVVEDALSVRNTEAMVRESMERVPDAAAEAEEPKPARKKARSPFAEAQDQLTNALGTKVRIAGTETKGKITIEYGSKEQLESFFEHLRTMQTEA